MYTKLRSVFNDNSTLITDVLYDKCSNFSVKMNENYPGISSSFTSTKSTITETFSNGTTYIYSIPASITSIPTTIGNKVNDIFEPIGSEEKEITRTPPNENLAYKVTQLDHARERLVYHILDLYSCKLSKECFEDYAEDVVFDDLIIYTTGLSNLKAQFYGMQKLFVKSTTEKYQILENSPDLMRINLIQKYTLPFVSRAVTYNSEIILELSENKITKHEDRWNGRPSGGEGMVRKGVAKLFALFISIPEN